MPDLDLHTEKGPVRISELMRDARPLFLNFRAPERTVLERWNARVKQVDASFEGVCELPVIGIVPLPSAVLVRPDGHVAWVGNETSEGLVEALTTWFGN